MGLFSGRKISLRFVIIAIGLAAGNCRMAERANDRSPSVRELTILYTNDEHGWMEGVEVGRGAAEMFGLWKAREGYSADGPYLILSGGDMWTGPAISTWFGGESMVEIMNAMGYNAAALGNHEFDFKTEGLLSRSAQSAFPYLSANIRLKENGQPREFVTPYVIEVVNDLRVGIIGLTTTSTPYTAFPDFVAAYTFIDYRQALADILPAVNADSPDVIIVISHLCGQELETLSTFAGDNGIVLLAGGHCHSSYESRANGVQVILAGSFMKSYGRIDLEYDIEAARLLSISTAIQINAGGAPDAAVAAVVAKWSNLVDLELAEVIAFSSSGVEQHSDAMHNLVPDAWLWRFTQAAVATTNYGGYRQGFPAGDISLADVVGVLPFLNSLYMIDLTGLELINFVSSQDVALGGMTTVGGFALNDGSAIINDSVYTMIVTDYMYSAFDELKTYDATPVETGIHWRQPVIDWLINANSSQAAPLETFLDSAARRQP